MTGAQALAARELVMRFLGDVSVAVALVAAVLGIWWAASRNRRETRSQALTEAQATIALLEKQNGLLEEQLAEQKKQAEARELEWKAREAEWREERKQLTKRIDDIDTHYRNLVLTVTTMGFCAAAATCPNYNPGDRRQPTVSI